MTPKVNINTITKGKITAVRNVILLLAIALDKVSGHHSAFGRSGAIL
jgi:hypothetical protein